MTYRESFNTLRALFDQSEEINRLPEEDISIHHFTFHSSNANVLPGAEDYRCDLHDVAFKESYTRIGTQNQQSYIDSLHAPDCDYQSNSRYRFSLFKPSDTDTVNDVILLFHGLNEKYWDKYLPWAQELVRRTGKGVLLFPIAFHMNRAPAEWSHPKKMRAVSAQRKQRHPAIVESSFANAAISARVNMIPQRFFWSGLQTYLDIIQLIHEIRNDRLAVINPDAGIDLFAYSIGSFLSEILMMTNHDGLFSDSRLFIFCGGPTLDRMYPVSKYIMDSEALVALYSFYIEHLDNEFKRHPRLSHYFNDGHSSGIYFRAMLSNHRFKELREKRFRELSRQIVAVALERDEVIPPAEVLNTLKGDFRDIPIPVQIEHFPYDYTHVTPFSTRTSIEREVNDSFDRIFKLAADHFDRD